ncbi:MAG: heme-binding protein [Alsobacter sp.]
MRRIVRAIVVALGLMLSGGVAMAETEQPAYRVEARSGDFEVRLYAPMVVAEVSVGGTRDAAVNEGFRILAGYIFGANEPAAKIAMTAPVTQQAGERIAMTAPVTQAGTAGGWIVRFTMPASWTLQTLPRPKDNRIRIVPVPERRMAAVRFSGLRTDARLQGEAERLEDFVRSRKLQPQGPAVYAYYDPPWTLPFLRRNEVLQEVRR